MSQFPIELKKPLLLASTSKYRRKIMDQLGLVYEVAAPEFEEEHGLDMPPEKLVMTLAAGKANSLKEKYPNHLIIGCDQLGEFDGKLLTKPGNFESAKDQLMAMNGRTHRLLTGLVVLDAATGQMKTHLDIHEMSMRKLSELQIEEYLKMDEPFDCAGSYKIESFGLGLFSEIKGGDYSAIIGLPALGLLSLLD